MDLSRDPSDRGAGAGPTVVAMALRLAIVGLGRMGGFHAGALAGARALDVVALVDPRPDARSGAQRWHRRAAGHSEPDAVLDPAVCEAVLVATPTPSHGPIVRRALEAGLHVLCEKPLTLDPEESDELGALATDRGLVLQVGFWRRFSPPWVAAKHAIDARLIGEPLLIRLSQWDAHPPPPEFCDPAVSGGLAIDCGVHEFDLAEWLSGRRIAAVRAESLPLVDAGLGAVGDVDNLLAIAELEGGGRAVVDLSRNARYGDDVRTEILGTDGAIFVDLLPHGVARIGTSAGMAPLTGSVAVDAMSAGAQGQAVAFASAVIAAQSGAVDPSVPDAAASARAVRIGAAVTRSLESGGTEQC